MESTHTSTPTTHSCTCRTPHEVCLRWICHSAIIDGPRSRRRAGLRTLVRTSHQPVSQPMLPSITPDKELCSSPVDGRQEDSIVSSFAISRVDYCNSLLAGVSTRPAAVCDERSSTINRRHQEAGSYQARVARPLPLASRPTARPVQAVSADIQGAA